MQPFPSDLRTSQSHVQVATEMGMLMSDRGMEHETSLMLA